MKQPKKKVNPGEFYEDPKGSGYFQLRPMRIKDVDTVCKLESDIFPSPWSKNAFETELLTNTFSESWVMEKENHIVAYVIIWKVLDEIHIANIAVSLEYRGRGIAFWIMQKLLNDACHNGATRCDLEVRKSNKAAINLYKKLNFKIVGLRKNYYQSENEDALLMSCELKEQIQKMDILPNGLV